MKNLLVVLLLFIGLYFVASSEKASADVSVQGETAMICVTTTEKFGKNCNNENSHSVSYKNSCNRPIRVSLRIMRKNGSGSHFLSSSLSPGDKSSGYVCSGTGQAIVKACEIGEKCKA